ncbi:MAG: hypothetical protein AAFP08_00345 [Bacteroidota bacterium]
MLKERELTHEANAKFSINKRIEEIKERIQQAAAEEMGLKFASCNRELLDHLNVSRFADPDIGLITHVNCNREEHTDTFWDQFGGIEGDERFQIFLISACDTQMPQRFGERLVYEILRHELDDDEAAIWYRFRSDDNRFFTDPLAVGPNLLKSKSAFEKYIARHFELKGDQDLQTFLKGQVAEYEHEFIVLGFQLSSRKWKPFLPEYYRWLAEQLQALTDEGPKVCLLLTHYLLDLHLPGGVSANSKKVLQSLDELAGASDDFHHLRILPSVPKEDFVDWMRDIGFDNPGDQQFTLQLLESELDSTARQQYDKDGLFDMFFLDKYINCICAELNK